MESNPITFNDFQQTFLISLGSNLIPEVTVNAATVEEAQPLAVAAMESQAATAIDALLKAMNESILATGSTDSWFVEVPLNVYVDDKDIKPVDDLVNTYVADPTNAYFVAGRKNGNGQVTDYVVAVAGTNPKSMYAIFNEDAEVLKPQPWPYMKSGGDKIHVTNGTLLSLDILLNDMGTSLVNSLAAITDENINITFTGHSLGGGLAPALALAVVSPETTEGQSVLKQANSNNWNFRIFPTAAPDIGDDAYVSALQSLFIPGSGTSPYIWNQKIWNSIDMVPQVWSKDFILNINSLYGSNQATPGYVQCLVKGLNDTIEGTNLGVNPYESLDPNKSGQFPGQYQDLKTMAGNDCGDECSGDAPEDVCEFLAEALYQHITAYFTAFSITDYAYLMPIPSPCDASNKLYFKDSPCAKYG